MKKIIIILAFACSVHMLSAQIRQSGSGLSTIDSLKHELQNTKNDTLRLVLINQLRYNYWFKNGNFDSALVYSKLLLPLTQKLDYKIDEAYTYDLIGDILSYQNSQNTLEAFFKGVKIAEDPGSENKMLPRKYLEMMTYWQPEFNSRLAKNNWLPPYVRLAVLESLYGDLANAYGRVMPNPHRIFFYFSKAIEICKSQKNEEDLALQYVNIAQYFYSTRQFDSCLVYAEKARALPTKYMESPSLSLIGTVYLKKGNYSSASPALRQSIQMGLASFTGVNWLAYLSFSEYLYKTGAIDSSLYYAKEAHKVTTEQNLPEEMQKTSAMLAALYKTTGAKDSALKYFELSSALSDSVNNADKKRKLQSQDFEEQVRQQELQDEKAKIKVYALLGGVGTLLITAFFLLRNNLQRKKTNALLQQKNQEIESALIELKSTQAQLIQSEKMASLGELTAGIAHEIQNPLNFVNNFSEVNKELLGELRAEIKKGNIEEVNAIADDLEANEEKINHHGKRADAIVKGMLQHSHTGTGQKEPTDLNALAGEYLRLSFQGLRAKDQTFNATLQTDFDNTIGKINIIPQDIGRVLLNLYNNAFYAVAEKKKQQPQGYEPIISVSTKRMNDKIHVMVKDNGKGIPQKVVDKIFQPFFTTKPAGQGTGLGLSLSYDIIKAHGGEIKVVTNEGEFAEFIIQLHVSNPL